MGCAGICSNKFYDDLGQCLFIRTKIVLWNTVVCADEIEHCVKKKEYADPGKRIGSHFSLERKSEIWLYLR